MECEVSVRPRIDAQDSTSHTLRATSERHGALSVNPLHQERFHLRPFRSSHRLSDRGSAHRTYDATTPKTRPTPAVSNMARAPQNVTLAVPLRGFAPPT